MTDPPRLLDTATSEPELRLLRAGALEDPPSAAMQRLLSALGGPAADSGATSGSHAPVSGTASFATTLHLASKVALVIVGGASIGGALWLHTQATPSTPAPEPRPIPALTAPMTSLAEPAQPAPAGDPARPTAERASALGPVAVEGASALGPVAVEGASSLPVAVEPATAPLRAAALRGERIHTRATAQLAREISLLDAVRAQLAAREARAALGALQHYMREYPQGLLRQEAALLRIEALYSAGDLYLAHTAATRFLKQNPDSPHAQRVRALADLH